MQRNKNIVFLLLCCANITISFNIAAISAAIPSIAQQLFLSDFEVAKIVSYYLIPYGLGALIYAPLTRFVTFRYTFTLCLLFYAGASLFCAFSQDLSTLLIGRVCMGLTGAGMIPLGLMVIGDTFDKKIRGRLVGVFFSCSFFASLGGLFAFGILGWRVLFIVPAMLGFILGIVFFLWRSTCLCKKHVGRINYFKVLELPKIQHIFIFIFFLSAFYHGVHKWYGVYLSQVYQMGQKEISFYAIIAVCGGFVGQILGGFVTDHYGRKMSCLCGLLGLSVSIMLLSGVDHKGFLAIVLFCISMSWTLGHNGISTVLTDFSDKHRPVVASLNSSIRFIAGGVGFALSHYFVNKSFPMTFLFIGMCILGLYYPLKKLIKNH